MKIYSHSLQGRRESNEDKHIHYLNIDGQDSTLNYINLFGVFDGHGGKLVSSFLKKQLPKYFMNKKLMDLKNNKSKFISDSYVKIFNRLQEKLAEAHPIAVKRCGSTAVCGINYKDNKNNSILWVINTGDSRSVLCNGNNEAIPLSFDHKPNSKTEKERIFNLGGKDKVYFDGIDWRVCDLSLSRSFGDLDASPYVTHKPEIYKYKLNKNDKFLIFACDGLWDVLSNKSAVNYINKLKEKKFKGNYAKSLAEYAYNKGSYDNVTVLIYFL